MVQRLINVDIGCRNIECHFFLLSIHHLDQVISNGHVTPHQEKSDNDCNWPFTEQGFTCYVFSPWADIPAGILKATSPIEEAFQSFRKYSCCSPDPSRLLILDCRDSHSRRHCLGTRKFRWQGREPCQLLQASDRIHSAPLCTFERVLLEVFRACVTYRVEPRCKRNASHEPLYTN